MSRPGAADDLYRPEFDSTWDVHRLHDLASWLNGLAFKNADFARSGTPVVKIAEVKNGITSQTRFTSAEYDPKFFLRNGDLLFCWSGQPETSIDAYRWSGGDGWLNQHIFKVLPDAEIIERDFFYYLLRYLRPTFVRIARNKQTTGLGHVTKADLKSLIVALPPRETQREIVATLGALDDKLASNERAIQKLDRLFHLTWRRLYSSDECHQERPLNELVKTQYGLTASASDDPSGIKFLRVMDINKSNWVEWSSVPTVPIADAGADKYLLRRGDLLVARMADPGKSAIYEQPDVPAVFASYLVRLKPSTYEAGLFIYGFLKSPEYLEYAAGATTGSVQKNMNARVIVGVSLRWPSDTALQEFANAAGPFRELLIAKVRENMRLQLLRDALMPQLFSGRIRACAAPAPVSGVLR